MSDTIWRTLDLYDQRAIPLGDKSNALTQAYVEMDLVVHGPGWPLALQHPCARDQNIQFVEEGHKYTVMHEGREIPCTSVTTVAHAFFPHFDAVEKCAAKVNNFRTFQKYEYYDRVVEFMAAYILHAVRDPARDPFPPWRRAQVTAFDREVAASDGRGISWPPLSQLLAQLHADTGLPVPRDLSSYTPQNLRRFLDVWFQPDRRGATHSPLVTQFAVDTLRFMWFQNSCVASLLGTYMHENIEFCYSGDPHEVVTREARLFVEFNEELKRTKGLEPYRTEWKVYDEELQIVGTIDMVYWDGQDDRKLWIYDWKRAKQLMTPEKIYWRPRYGTVPLTKMLEDCNFHHYSMQLNIYKTILERKYGRTVQAMNLVVLHPAQRAPIVQPVYERPTLCQEIAAYRLATIPPEMRVKLMKDKG